MQNHMPTASLVNQYKLFCQRYSLEPLIKHAIERTCRSSTLIDHIFTNSRKKISQSGVIDIGISDHQLICLTRKLHMIKSNTHKQIKIRSLKNYIIESLNQGLSMTNFPDYEYFNDVDIAYSSSMFREIQGTFLLIYFLHFDNFQKRTHTKPTHITPTRKHRYNTISY